MRRNALYYVENIRTIIMALATDRFVGHLAKTKGKTMLYECSWENSQHVINRIKKLINDNLINDATNDGVNIRWTPGIDEIIINDKRNEYQIDIEQTTIRGSIVISFSYHKR